MIITLSAIFFFIIFRFVVSLFNFISDPKLRRVNRIYDDKISILIPARNEKDSILALLQSINRQDYQNYEVIILDDASADNTYRLCEEFAVQHPKFTVIKGRALPPGWTGKNYACYQLAQKAGGNYLLFIDADTQMQEGLLNSCLHRMQLKKLALLSLYANQEMPTFAEQTVVPLMHYILLNILPLQLVYLIRSKAVAAASGQFMLFDANVYARYQWHREVKEKPVEDVEIMRLVKAGGHSGETLLANKMLYSRLNKNYFEAITRASRNILSAFNYNVLALLVYLILVIGGPLIIIATLNLNLIVFMCSLIILSRMMISFSAGQNALRNVILHPIQLFNLMLISFLSIQRYLTRTTVWKDRRI